MADRIPLTETREWKAREKLGAAVEARKHLEHMIVFWANKLAEIQKHLDDAKANLARVTAEEQDLRDRVIPLVMNSERKERKAKLLEEKAKLLEQLAALEASDL